MTYRKHTRPTTEAGKALYDMGPSFAAGMTLTQFGEAILAIEHEAEGLRECRHHVVVHSVTTVNGRPHGETTERFNGTDA